MVVLKCHSCRQRTIFRCLLHPYHRRQVLILKLPKTMVPRFHKSQIVQLIQHHRHLQSRQQPRLPRIAIHVETESLEKGSNRERTDTFCLCELCIWLLCMHRCLSYVLFCMYSLRRKECRIYHDWSVIV